MRHLSPLQTKGMRLRIRLLAGVLAVGCLVSFLVSLLVIRFLTDFVKRHTFVPFGIYRILLGAAVLLYFLLVR